MNYNQAVEIFSDLAYIIMPFDKTTREYQLLLSRLKDLLVNQTGSVKLYDLMDAALRLNQEIFNDTIRRMVKEGNYSRSTPDICICLYFFALQYKNHKQTKDLDLFREVLKQIKWMQTDHMKIEYINLITKAFTMAVEFASELQYPEDFILIEDFLPKLVRETSNELNRCNMGDIVNILESYYALYDKNIFKTL